MTALYNEIDEYAARWISNLIMADHVAHGGVDTRSITELCAEDVRHATQAHFFAGIAVWSAAARSAGWPDAAPLWSGSCPCQPFSQAGRGVGIADERHLWPEWFRLIRECRPPVVVGEQVASQAGLGWLDVVFTDLEREGYACGAVDFGAASVGAPHARQRLYFVAIADGERLEGLRVQLRERRSQPSVPQTGRRGADGALAHTEGSGWQERGDPRSADRAGSLYDSSPCCGNDGAGSPIENAPFLRGGGLPHQELAAGFVADSRSKGLEIGGEQFARCQFAASERGGETRGFWDAAEWLYCRDGKARPVEPGTFPLVNGATARVGRLRAYGNAIVKPQAQVFLETVIEILTDTEGASFQ